MVVEVKTHLFIGATLKFSNFMQKVTFLNLFLQFALYGMSHSIPDRSIVGDFTRFFLDSMYYTPAEEGVNASA